MTKEELGRRVKQIREQMGLAQLDFAELCDLAPGYIGGLETGQKNPTLDMLNKIANGCGISLNEIFCNEGNAPRNEDLIYRLVANAKPLDETRLLDLIMFAQALQKYSK